MGRSFYIILITVFLLSCKKYQLRQPTSIEVRSSLDYVQNGASSITISSGIWHLDRLRVDGDRVEGEDVFIEREYYDEEYDISNAVYSLDIPVGEYQELSIALKLDVVNDVAMRMSGVYNGSSQPIPFMLQFQDDFIIEFEKENNDNLNLKKKENYTFTLQYDHSILFGSISQAQWESANLTDVGGVMTVVISDSDNGLLYDLIEDALPQAITFSSN